MVKRRYDESPSCSDISSPPFSPSTPPLRKISKASSVSKPVGRTRSLHDNQPLRRGTACLMCRAKKLKCSAAKPQCDQCIRRREKCVYDSVRPASRVEELARKLAEIEENERQAAVNLMNERRSSSGVSQNGVSSSMPFSSLEGYGYPMSNGTSNPYQSTSTTQVASGSVSPSDTLQALPPKSNDFQWAGWADINPFQIRPETSTSTSGMTNTSLPTLSYSWDQGQSTQSPDCWIGSHFQPQQLPLPTRSQSDPSHYSQNIGMYPAQLPSLSYFSIPSGNGTSTVPIFPASFDQSSFQSFTPTWPTYQGTNGSGLSQPPFVKELDEDDIAQSARDYLTELFFSPPREAYGTECFTEAQFKARMEGPVDRRYHPCLLFAIYTEAASSSYIPAVRALADALYKIASNKIAESIKSEDRILDAIRASKILGKWSNGRARVLEGYTWTWLSVSLAVACRLDKIPSSVFDPTAKVDPAAWPILGPPKDQWDLCERIHAFWSLWANEKGSSCLTGWPSGLRDDLILTPLARRPEVYLNGSIKNLPDVRLRDIYDQSTKTMSRIDYKFSWMFTTVHLMHRAMTLQDQRSESDPTYRSFATSANPESNTTQTIREKYPKQYHEMMETLDHVERNLPREFGIDFMSATPWSDKDIPMIHACLLTARMHLHPNIATDTTDLNNSLSAARTQIRIIKLWIDQLKADDKRDIQRKAQNHPHLPSNFSSTSTSTSASPTNQFNVNLNFTHPTNGTGVGAQGTKRHKRAKAGPYMLMCWFKTVEVLREVADVYRSSGRGKEAEECLMESQGILAGLQGLGVSRPS